MADDLEPNDIWQRSLEEDEARMNDEITQMVDRLAARGLLIDYAYRKDDNKHFIVMEGDKCYGQAPQVHAYLSGACAARNA